MKPLVLAVLALASACVGAPAFAQEPLPSPTPAVRMSLSTATAVALGRADTSVRYFISADVQGPLVVGDKAVGDLGLTLSVETLPGKTESDVDLASWGNAVQFAGYAGRRVGEATFGPQRVSSSIVVEGRFASSFFDATAEPQRKRFYRAYGVGIQATLHLPERDAYFRLLYGRDESVGSRGVGQLLVSGELPTVKDVRIYAKAGLGLGTSSLSGEQVDYFLVGLGRRW